MMNNQPSLSDQRSGFSSIQVHPGRRGPLKSSRKRTFSGRAVVVGEGVSVGFCWVAVGGRGVKVGGTEVLVGGIGVSGASVGVGVAAGADKEHATRVTNRISINSVRLNILSSCIFSIIVFEGGGDHERSFRLL
jgi:hypothetical protein